jgi:hypothetical protein
VVAMATNRLEIWHIQWQYFVLTQKVLL